MYCSLSKMLPYMGNELKELLKEGMGMFSRVVILLWKIQPPHTQSSTIYVCRHAAILQCLFCHTIAYAITVNGVCLHFVSPSSCTVLLLWWFLHNCMYTIGIKRWAYFRKKSTLCNNFVEKRGV